MHPSPDPTDDDPKPALEQALDVLTRRLTAPHLVIDHRSAVGDLSTRLAALTEKPPAPTRAEQGHPSVRRRIDDEVRASPASERRSALARLLRIDPATVRPRQIHWFEPGPPDRVAEVFGDLLAARHLAVFVPDAEADLSRFDHHVAGPAAEIAAAMARARGPLVATIGWLGYRIDATTVIDLRGEDHAGVADPAGRRLSEWLDALPEVPGQQRYLVGRGFGELVALAALAAGAAAEPAPERW